MINFSQEEFMVENLEKIKAAIEIETKYRYIDVHGKTQNFSSFIKSEAKKNYKKSNKNPRWAVVMEAFDVYPYASVPERRKSIECLIRTIKADLAQEAQILKEEEQIQQNRQKHPAQVDVMYIKGVGPKVAYKFNKLGIFTAQDLMMYFPKKHIDYSSRTLIKNLKEGQTTTIFGYIKSVSTFNSRNNLSVTKVQIKDESGRFELNFFNAKGNKYILERMKSQFPINSGIMVSGVVKLNSYNNQLTLDKPTYSIMSGEFMEDKEEKNLNLARIVPIYTVCEGLSAKTLRKAIYNAIELYKDEIVNIIPDFIRERLGLLDKKFAVQQIHFPDSISNLERARFSLIFEELFLVQLKLIRLRENTAKNTSSYALKVHQNGIVRNFINNLPFELTSGQKQAINEILNDMNSATPMQRLLQGDVGSGKTVVATIMLLAAIENGYQGALMAPTEILAQQHYNNLIQWLTPMGLSVGLFLGSHGKKVRQKFETDLKNGQTHIAVGTHALIQENIEFNNLGAIVVDEQHRFGVKQRNVLKKKSQNPQILTMTATPIPRTLALTVHGDLDLTVINELPKGRKPIKTTLTGSRRLVWDLIKQQVNEGRQAYIVYPLIDESETLSAKAATIEAERLQNDIFPEFKIGLLHGKLKNDEKDEVMKNFKEGKFDILVSTTVVEVGVDVPNATVMVIENAERFGLSQLHQLRGRVGRNSLQSYCVLITSSRSQETRERLGIMTQTNDGFVIAEKDLQLRGPGEFLGTRQSGLPDLIISDIVRDAKILELARNEALDFVKEYDIEKFPLLQNVTALEMFTGLDI
ncbi:MAG: ATP-dependent DNA helicase RecG [Cyanobacteria bacterium SIG26]|nr:ATP-dependent DNA helicase RecG [Cyanobacteria bacterium SIG26]